MKFNKDQLKTILNSLGFMLEHGNLPTNDADKAAELRKEISADVKLQPAPIEVKAPPPAEIIARQHAIFTPAPTTYGKELVFVLCANASGEPEFFIADVSATKEQCSKGEHLLIAEREAASDGYEVVGSFDANDPAARQLQNMAAMIVRREHVDVKDAAPSAPAMSY